MRLWLIVYTDLKKLFKKRLCSIDFSEQMHFSSLPSLLITWLIYKYKIGISYYI